MSATSPPATDKVRTPKALASDAASAPTRAEPATETEGTASDRAADGTIEPKAVPIPRWMVRSFWLGHRLLYSITGGRRGLRPPEPDRYGMLRLQTTGRRSGKARHAILAYFDDGPDLVLVPMNGWADAEPAWWLNLQAHPDAVVELPSGTRAVRARRVEGEERARLWTIAAEGPWGEDMDAFAAGRARETQIVVLEPRSDHGHA